MPSDGGCDGTFICGLWMAPVLHSLCHRHAQSERVTYYNHLSQRRINMAAAARNLCFVLWICLALWLFTGAAPPPCLGGKALIAGIRVGGFNNTFCIVRQDVQNVGVLRDEESRGCFVLAVLYPPARLISFQMDLTGGFHCVTAAVMTIPHSEITSKAQLRLSDNIDIFRVATDRDRPENRFKCALHRRTQSIVPS